MAVVVAIASVSDSNAPSCAHTFGYTAAPIAAMTPTRGPPTARPSNPVSTTVAAPARHDQSKWASSVSSPTNDGIAR